MLTISLTLTLFAFSVARKEKVPLARRGLSFENYQKSRILQGSELEVVMRIDNKDCAMLCSRIAKCKSYNYCKSRKCHLNSLDEYSENVKMESNLDCNYYGIRKDDRPFCAERSVAKEIKNDIYPGVCQINQKRTDARWTKIEQYVAIDSGNEWKKMEDRECFIASHGGKEVCTGNETSVLEWYRLIAEDKYFYEGIEACSQIDGVSFYRVNGTDQQLKFFHELLNQPYCYWLGIKRAGASQEWKSFDGKEIPQNLFRWAHNQPNNNPNEDFMCILAASVHDCISTNICHVVCDMNLL